MGVGDIVTFDTTTCEFKTEAFNTISYQCYDNRSANVSKNTIVALVHNAGSLHVLKYTKGDKSATIIDID